MTVSTATEKLLIAGEWVESSGGEHRVSIDPATGAPLATFAEASTADVDSAVASARSAFESAQWRDMTPDRRGQLLWRVAELLEREAGALAELETRDNGQPIAMSGGVNLPLAAQVFRYYAGWATKIEGKLSSVSIPNTLHYTKREPLGVCGIITPWNFPLAIAAWKLAPALAAGNTVVLKPAEQTPLTTLRLAQICLDAGIPAGVVNVITGGPAVGRALVSHPGVDKISFTGSTEVGRQIVASAASDLKRLGLELGGKAPSIICPDADIDAAVTGNLQGALFNSGQACGAYTRFYVHESRAAEFTDKLAAAAAGLKVGPGLEPDTFLGPLISAEQVDRVDGYVKSGIDQGAELVTGGSRAAGPGLDEGFFYAPTVFANVRDDMTIAREEIFGPVMSVFTYTDTDEVVARANDTDYGLAAVVWTNDLVVAHTLASRIHAGTVFVNLLPLIDPGAPWGGFGLSGWGREMGSFGIDEFTETKGVFINLAR
jgi:acyl-CoA reductase-like NAD-dependent aldehyde dehydrogenase